MRQTKTPAVSQQNSVKIVAPFHERRRLTQRGGDLWSTLHYLAGVVTNAGIPVVQANPNHSTFKAGTREVGS